MADTLPLSDTDRATTPKTREILVQVVDLEPKLCMLYTTIRLEGFRKKMAGKYDKTRGYTILYRCIRGLPKKNKNTIILDNKLHTIHIYYNKTRGLPRKWRENRVAKGVARDTPTSGHVQDTCSGHVVYDVPSGDVISGRSAFWVNPHWILLDPPEKC